MEPPKNVIRHGPDRPGHPNQLCAAPDGPDGPDHDEEGRCLGITMVSNRSKFVNLILLIIVLMILFGGGGYYYGGPYVGGGLGTVLLIVLIVLLVRG
jgi:hypothetical protein